MAVPDREKPVPLSPPAGAALEARPLELRQSAQPGPEEALLCRETVMDLHHRLHSLPEPYREVFSLRTLGELSFAQIGELFGKSEGWARVTYYRAKLKLQEDTP